jgi:methionyl-tRNA formyltransferase
VRVILVGYGELASSLMLGVLESKHKLVGILRWEKTKGNKIISSLKDFFWADQFTSLIRSYKINEIEAESVNSPDFIKKALKLQPDVIIVGSWGEVLKKKTIILPKIACINCHPSLLPSHRGSNPYVSVIKQGETKTGITFHLVDESIDTGPILLQKEVEISDSDTGGSLRTKCSYTARESVKELLDGLEDARFLPKKQSNIAATYFPRPHSKDTIIKWSNTAQEIHNQIRSLNPWMKCYARYKDQFIMVESSRIIKLKNSVNEHGKILLKRADGILVSTADPYKAILIENPKIYGFLSNLWSPLFIKSLIKPGSYLK